MCDNYLYQYVASLNSDEIREMYITTVVEWEKCEPTDVVVPELFIDIAYNEQDQTHVNAFMRLNDTKRNEIECGLVIASIKCNGPIISHQAPWGINTYEAKYIYKTLKVWQSDTDMDT